MTGVTHMKHPMDTWVWVGTPGHFFMADKCAFHLNTVIGRYLVSTVGEMFDREGCGPELKRLDIGPGRKYETMVFLAGAPCDCGCGWVDQDSECLEMAPYNDPAAARKGHMAMCLKYAEVD